MTNTIADFGVKTRAALEKSILAHGLRRSRLDSIDELGAVATSEMWAEIYDRVAELVREHTTTFVFVGTRRMSERVAFALGTRLGEGVVLPHHGSLSRTSARSTSSSKSGRRVRSASPCSGSDGSCYWQAQDSVRSATAAAVGHLSR